MAWSDIPQKIAVLEAEPYYAANTVKNLIKAYGGTQLNGPDSVDLIPDYRRADFEEQIDYYTEACKNLFNSRAVRPSKDEPI